MALPRWTPWLSLLGPLLAGGAARIALGVPVQVAEGVSPTWMNAMADELLVQREGQFVALDGLGHERVVMSRMPEDTLAVAADYAGRVYWSQPAWLNVLDTVTGQTVRVSSPTLNWLVWSCDRLVGLATDGASLVTWGPRADGAAPLTTIPIGSTELSGGRTAPPEPPGRSGLASSPSTATVQGIFPERECGRVGAWTGTEVGVLVLSDGGFAPRFSATVRDVRVYGDKTVTLEGEDVVLRAGEEPPRRRSMPGAHRLAGQYTGGPAVLTTGGDVLAVPLW
jgi:hypothetical protein